MRFYPVSCVPDHPCSFGAVILVLHTYLGLHIVRRTLVFSDLVLDQLAAVGALVGIGLGIQYGSGYTYVASMVTVLFGALLLPLIKPKTRSIPRDLSS